jgi:hypothetical protein
MCWLGGRRDSRFLTINCGGLAAEEPSSERAFGGKAISLYLFI